jgi:hypothetical protein
MSDAPSDAVDEIGQGPGRFDAKEAQRWVNRFAQLPRGGAYLVHVAAEVLGDGQTR